jgi:hypothetical protein
MLETLLDRGFYQIVLEDNDSYLANPVALV